MGLFALVGLIVVGYFLYKVSRNINVETKREVSHAVVKTIDGPMLKALKKHFEEIKNRK